MGVRKVAGQDVRQRVYEARRKGAGVEEATLVYIR
jgi:hypothetical protein